MTTFRASAAPSARRDPGLRSGLGRGDQLPRPDDRPRDDETGPQRPDDSAERARRLLHAAGPITDGSFFGAERHTEELKGERSRFRPLL